MSYYASEKSSAAIYREALAKIQFDLVRQEVDSVLHERVVDSLTLCRCSNDSLLGTLPGDIMKHIVSYLHQPVNNKTKEQLQLEHGYLVDVVDKRVVFNGLINARVDRYRLREITRGSSVTIPLSTPNFHLTSPSYRSFAKYVRTFEGYHSRRIGVSGPERFQYRNGGKHTVYWVSIVFKLPIIEPLNKHVYQEMQRGFGVLH